MKQQLQIISTIFLLFVVAFLSGCSQINTSNVMPASGPVTLQPNPRHIALLLPVTGSYAGAGQAVRDGFLAAYYNTKPSNISPTVVRVYDTNKSSISDLYQQALGDKANIIIGPLQKDKVRQLMRMPLSIPVIALNYPPNVHSLPSGFYEFGLSPQNESAEVATKAWADGRRRMLIIYPTGEWGAKVAGSFARQWQGSGGQIVGTLVYRSSQDFNSAIKQLLQAHTCPRNDKSCTPGRRTDVDAIFLVANPQAAQAIVPMLQFYYAGNLPVYATSLIYNGLPNPSLYNDMNNVYFCDMPWVLNNNAQMQQLRQQIMTNWSNTYQNYFRLYALGLDAFALTNQLDILAANANATYAGATGTLYVSNEHKIMRRLSWGQFRNGQAYFVG